MNKMSDRRFCSVAAAAGLVLVVLFFSYAEAGSIQKRAIEEPSITEAPKPKYCHRSTPCGWAVYVPFTREIVHWMPNTCKCQEGLDCIRTEDDYSVTAYVHRCRVKPTPTISDSDQHLQNNSP